MTEFPLAIVTGAARRIGRIFALALAREGYSILLHYHLHIQEAQATAEEIRSLNVPVYLQQADLTQFEEIGGLFELTDSLPHPLKVVVNSAAVMDRADARTLSVTDWDATFALNLRAPFIFAQQAYLRMREGGLIVNITDMAAWKSWHAYPAYSVSKAALEALTRVLARSFAPEVRVNAIAPGLVMPSDITSSEQWEKMIARLPMRRPAGEHDLVSALMYLIENNYVTGQTIFVDGGYSLL